MRIGVCILPELRWPEQQRLWQRAEARPKGTLLTSEADVSVVDAEKPSLLYMMQVLYLP